ncbi:MAG: nitronate monooxygenase [Archangium sp.]
MSPETRVTSQLGIRYPIIQGPFGGGLSSVALAAIVSEAGGLGSFGAHIFDAAGIKRIASEIRERTKKPFALNLWISPGETSGSALNAEQFAAAVEHFRPLYEELKVTPPSAPPERYGQRFEDRDRSAARGSTRGVQLRVRNSTRRRARGVQASRHRHARSDHHLG